MNIYEMLPEEMEGQAMLGTSECGRFWAQILVQYPARGDWTKAILDAVDEIDGVIEWHKEFDQQDAR